MITTYYEVQTRGGESDSWGLVSRYYDPPAGAEQREPARRRAFREAGRLQWAEGGLADVRVMRVTTEVVTEEDTDTDTDTVPLGWRAVETGHNG